MSRELDEKLYVYPGTSILRNTLNICDKEVLDAYERQVSIQRIREGIPQGAFDLRHLQAIHRHIFQDVYEWAGELRQVPLNKGGSQFFPHTRLESGMADIHGRLVKQRFLKGLDHEQFSHAAGEIMGDVNYLHPFREGNGRTQLQYLKQLGQQAGYDVCIGEFGKEQWIAASIAANDVQYEPMIKVIAEHTVALEQEKSKAAEKSFEEIKGAVERDIARGRFTLLEEKQVRDLINERSAYEKMVQSEERTKLEKAYRIKADKFMNMVRAREKEQALERGKDKGKGIVED